jgi:hypothetical protein
MRMALLVVGAASASRGVISKLHILPVGVEGQVRVQLEYLNFLKHVIHDKKESTQSYKVVFDILWERCSLMAGFWLRIA